MSPPIPEPLASIHSVKLQLFFILKSAVWPDGDVAARACSAKQQVKTAAVILHFVTIFIVRRLKEAKE
jgi:hypothetical protein